MLTKITTKFKKFISILVCAMMVSLTFPVNMLSSAVYSEDNIAYPESQTTAVPCEDEDIELNGGDGHVVEVSTLKELQRAISNAQPGVQTAIALTKDIKTSNGFFSSPEYSLECDETSGKKTIKITSKDPASPRTITLDSSKSGLLRVKNSNVTLENINIIGTAEQADVGVSEDKYQKSAIRVEGGSITIGEGVKFSKYSKIDPGNKSADRSHGNIIWCDKGTVNIEGGEFSYCGSNHARGGVVYCSGKGTVNVSGGHFHHCLANYGMIYSENANVNIKGGEFNNCQAWWEGAVLYTDVSIVTISGGIFKNCIASWGGNVLYANASNVTIAEGSFENFGDHSKGSSVVECSNTNLIMNGGNISNCRGEKGAAIRILDGSSFIMQGGTISNCSAEYGGAIWISGGEKTSSFDMQGGTISKCYAERAGGAIFADYGAKIKLQKGTIADCNAWVAGNSIAAFYKETTIAVPPPESGLLKISIPPLNFLGIDSKPEICGGYKGIYLTWNSKYNKGGSEIQYTKLETIETNQSSPEDIGSSKQSHSQESAEQTNSNAEGGLGTIIEEDEKDADHDEDMLNEIENEPGEDEGEDEDEDHGYSDNDIGKYNGLKEFLEKDPGSEIVQLDEANGIVLTAKDGIIPPGYHFVAEKIQKDSNEWNDRIKNLDDKQKNDIENIGIYEMSIKNSSEQTFTLPENKTVRIFMPCPAGWDKNDLQVVHISAGLDEDFTEEITTVNGQDYCTFKTTHFSPYAIIDEISKNDIFEMMAPWLIGAAVIAIGAVAAVVIVLKNKNKSRA